MRRRRTLSFWVWCTVDYGYDDTGILKRLLSFFTFSYKRVHSIFSGYICSFYKPHNILSKYFVHRKYYNMERVVKTCISDIDIGAGEFFANKIWRKARYCCCCCWSHMKRTQFVSNPQIILLTHYICWVDVCR